MFAFSKQQYKLVKWGKRKEIKKLAFCHGVHLYFLIKKNSFNEYIKGIKL